MRAMLSGYEVGMEIQLKTTLVLNLKVRRKMKMAKLTTYRGRIIKYCEHCHGEIYCGDKVYKAVVAGRARTKYWHKKCFEAIEYG